MVADHASSMVQQLEQQHQVVALPPLPEQVQYAASKYEDDDESFHEQV